MSSMNDKSSDEIKKANENELPKINDLKLLNLTSPSENECEFLLFRLSERWMAVPIKQIIEIIRWHPCNKLPFSYSRIDGLLNFRGESIPVFSLPYLLGVKNHTSVYNFIVISQYKSHKFAFSVESVDQVRTLNKNEIQQDSQIDLMVNQKLLKGVLLWNSKTLFILDTEGVIAA